MERKRKDVHRGLAQFKFMKKYYMFYDGGYSEQYHVLANSKEEALEYVKKFCIESDMKSYEHFRTVLKNDYASFDEFLTRHGYNYKNYLRYSKNAEYIHEFNEGEVNTTEVC